MTTDTLNFDEPSSNWKTTKRVSTKWTISKRQRWSLTGLTLLAFAFVQAVIVFVGCISLVNMKELTRIDLRLFPPVAYKNLDMSETVYLQNRTTVYHVTKEFSPASMGGMGMVVTALAEAQRRQRGGALFDVHVVLPFYSILPKENFTRIADLSIPVSLEGRNRNLHFSVFTGRHEQPNGPPVTMHLIGPATEHPFNLAFQVSDVPSMYGSPRALPWEWKDQYFCKAVARFILYRHHHFCEACRTGSIHERGGVDVLHLHGATNSFVSYHINQYEEQGLFSNKGYPRPSVVYTLHDYADELDVSISEANVLMFLDNDRASQRIKLQRHKYGRHIHTSGIGASLADMVTLVSRTMAQDIVEGRFDFVMKEIIMEYLLAQTKKERFYGVTNGVDYGTMNPFEAPVLIQNGLSFPPAAFLLNSSTSVSQENLPVIDIHGIPSTTTVRILDCKRAAKMHLHSAGILPGPLDNVEAPLFLFIGRFQFNKGMEYFSTAANYISNHGAKLVAMGQRNNFPIKKLKELESKHPNNVLVIDDSEHQKEWGLIWRTAADFVLVPSLTESFGLVAAEGLLFGAGVVSSGVGGLKEYLVNRNFSSSLPPSLDPHHNAYLFDIFSKSAHHQLEVALSDALSFHRKFSQNESLHEQYLWKLVQDALHLAWDRKDGPIDAYTLIYQKAIQNARISGR